MLNSFLCFYPLKHRWAILVIGGHCPAELNANPYQTHLTSFLVNLMKMSVYSEQNAAVQ